MKSDSPTHDFTSIRRRAPEKRDKASAHADGVCSVRQAGEPITAIAAAVGLSRPTIYDVLAYSTVSSAQTT